ncbi:MAG TPA: D-alanyl-D-alanine carboxypeptidase, partial [Devosia sp.]|nr:D-alanyl-D-alanine carboxypeptidase [Devosia sp.]
MLQSPDYRARWLAQAIAMLSLALFLVGNARANPLLLVDMQTSEVLMAQDAGRPWYPASLVKLATAFVTFRAIENGQLSLNTPVIISGRAAAAPPGKSGLAAETAISMEDALNLLIVKSANDVAIAIAESVSGSVENFVVEMNEAAGALGMTGTRFANPHGLFDANQVTTARDMAVLSLAIRRHYPQYGGIFATSVVRIGEKSLRS